MTRNLEELTKAQLIALGFQNKIQMKYLPRGKDYCEHLIEGLDALKVIVGLETKENGQQTVS